MKWYFFYFLILLWCPYLCAQPRDTLENQLFRGQQQTESGQYKEAVATYLAILEKDDVVPVSMCYFFGKALYRTRRWKEAQRVLSIYQEKARDSTKFEDAARLVRALMAEQKSAEKCPHCDFYGYRYQVHSLCEGTGYVKKTCSLCRGYGKIPCGLCYGQGLMIEWDKYQKRRYIPCILCQNKGIVPCLTCQQKGQVKTLCLICEKTGKITTKSYCKHEKKPISYPSNPNSYNK